ncbi:aminopeptidase P family protein [Sandaracinus amylolyticus]|uniref:Xaa-Pro aminopeptidase n=1 Tax=Sandaracinus amylolyticus TaxID=927083 RepID=A0A0F6YK32_9BACT|nr:aminopeptidase P family protein [Sandaracinus amylolyticus]AKF07635.1 Xaa-Pro aminopeptidase [Sandaracinus amylolyticus]
MLLPRIDTAALVARRARLSKALEGAPALIAAGAPSPRNYRANPWPYRAASHFLYLAGAPIPGAFLLLEGDAATLFVETPDDDDELWHGPSASLADLAAAVGCAVRDASDLPRVLAGRRVATLPAIDAPTRERQSDLLGRPVRYGALAEDDAALADAMIALRLVHDEAAIRGLREAADGTAAAHLAGMRATRVGLREHAIRGAMESALLTRGMGTSYQSIVTVHGEVLHNHGYGHELREGDLLLADVGAETEGGWAGDVTRTWPVSGRFSETQRSMYELVLTANRAAIEKVAPGVRYRDVHLASCHVIARGLVDLGVLRGDPEELVADGVHALFFPHGVGHLIGLDVHDMEDLGDRAGYAPGRTRSSQFGLSYLRLDRDLAPGMAVTIEPGFYVVPAILRDPKLKAIARDRIDHATLERFADVRGIRVEDDVLVTATGAEVLTSAIPKTVRDVEHAVGGG